jgi:AcrR family transcriptional regulator
MASHVHTVPYGTTIRYRMEMARTGSLSRDDWTAAALTALSERGVGAVAVQPLASVLGATKGSFYWHFSDRAELLGATLDLWEHRATHAVTEQLDAVDDPAERLRLLFGMTFGSTANGRVDVALMAAADDPVIADALARVTARRVAWLERNFRAMGLPAPQARRQALLAYTAWIGLAQLQQAVPSAVPSGAARARYLDHLLATLSLRR